MRKLFKKFLVKVGCFYKNGDSCYKKTGRHTHGRFIHIDDLKLNTKEKIQDWICNRLILCYVFICEWERNKFKGIQALLKARRNNIYRKKLFKMKMETKILKLKNTPFKNLFKNNKLKKIQLNGEDNKEIWKDRKLHKQTRLYLLYKYLEFIIKERFKK